MDEKIQAVLDSIATLEAAFTDFVAKAKEAVPGNKKWKQSAMEARKLSVAFGKIMKDYREKTLKLGKKDA